jgi:hypothetical protein
MIEEKLDKTEPEESHEQKTAESTVIEVPGQLEFICFSNREQLTAIHRIFRFSIPKFYGLNPGKG